MRTNRYGQPEFTCPLIDRIKMLIDRQIQSNDLDTSDLEDCLSLLEDVRDANSALRDCSTEYIQRYEDEQELTKQIQKELDQLGEKYDDLQSSSSYDIEQLQSEINNLNDQIYQLS